MRLQRQLDPLAFQDRHQHVHGAEERGLAGFRAVQTGPVVEAAVGAAAAAELADERQRFAAPRLAMVRSTEGDTSAPADGSRLG